MDASWVSQNGDKTLYDNFIEAMGLSRTQQEYYRYLSALTSFPQPELVRRTLALVDDGKLRQQDYVRLFSALLASDSARDITWDYLKVHWEGVAEKVTTFAAAAPFPLWAASAPPSCATM